MGQELGRRRGELGCRGGKVSQAGRRALRDDNTVMNQHPLEQSKAPAELDQLRGLVSDLPPFWALATTSERGSFLSLEAAYWGPPPVRLFCSLLNYCIGRNTKQFQEGLTLNMICVCILPFHSCPFWQRM